MGELMWKNGIMGDSRNGIGGIRCRNNGLDSRVTGLDEGTSANGDKNLISVDIGYVSVLINACCYRG